MAASRFSILYSVPLPRCQKSAPVIPTGKTKMTLNQYTHAHPSSTNQVPHSKAKEL